MTDKRIQRLGDTNSGGGIITKIPQDFVFDEDLLISVNGSIGTGHGDPDDHIHDAGVWQTSNGSDFVFIEDIPVNFEGNTDTCGDVRLNGSDYIFIEV